MRERAARVVIGESVKPSGMRTGWGGQSRMSKDWDCSVPVCRRQTGDLQNESERENERGRERERAEPRFKNRG